MAEERGESQNQSKTKRPGLGLDINNAQSCLVSFWGWPPTTAPLSGAHLRIMTGSAWGCFSESQLAARCQSGASLYRTNGTMLHEVGGLLEACRLPWHWALDPPLQCLLAFERLASPF